MDTKLQTTKNKTVLALLVLVLSSFSGFSQTTNTFTGVTGGNWGVAANWSSGVPLATHDVVIPDNINVVINIPSAVCNKLTINTGVSSNSVTVGANTLTVSGAVTINAPTANNQNKIVSVTSGTLNCGSIVMGNSTGGTRDCRVMVTSGTLNVSGDVTMNGSSNENQIILDGTTTGGTLNMGGNFLGNGGDIVPGNFSTVNFNGTVAQTIIMNGNFQYNNIVINNPVGATISANLTTGRVLGNVTVQSGILNNGGFSITGNGTRTFTVANGATLSLSGTSNVFPASYGTYVLGATSTVEYKAAGNQNIYNVASPGYGHLITSTSGTKTAAGTLYIQGNVTVNIGTTVALANNIINISGNLSNSGTVTATTGTLNFAGNFVNAGTFTGGTTSTLNLTGNFINTGIFTAGTGVSNLNIKGNWTNSGVFTCGSASTVTFNSLTTGKTISGTITGVTGKFNNVSFNGIGGSWTIANDLDIANTLTVTNGTVYVNGILGIAGATALTVAAGGTFVLQDSASLIQSGYAGANSGNIIVKRNTTPIMLQDYTYWSSPTTGSQTLLNFSPNTATYKFFTYHNSWAYTTPATDTFTKGIGYAISAPLGTSASVAAVVAHQFTGVPNNGNVDVPVALGPNPISNRLIGNPYPSAIDADAFILANLVGAGTVNQTISGTLYFWTHNHSTVANSYSSSDYATYNLTGGTAVSTGTGRITAPIRYIASGQGFFVHTVANGNVSFRNTMRTGTTNTNFYKSANATTAVTTLESHRIWLNLTNSTDSFSQALIGYVQTATNDFNPGLDGLFFGAEQHALYSLLEGGDYTIQAKALPFVNTDTVPIGYKTNVAGNTTISIDHTDGLFSDGQNIYLEDKLLNVIHDLKASSYTFSSAAGTFNNRFVLRYQNQALGTGDIDETVNSVTVASGNQQIYVKSENLLLSKITVYDVLGRMVFDGNNIGNTVFTISNMASSQQALIMKIVLENGQTVTKKIVF